MFNVSKFEKNPSLELDAIIHRANVVLHHLSLIAHEVQPNDFKELQEESYILATMIRRLDTSLSNGGELPKQWNPSLENGRANWPIVK